MTLRYLRPLRDSVCLLYKTFSLSLHIPEEPKIYLLWANDSWFKPIQDIIYTFNRRTYKTYTKQDLVANTVLFCT